MGTPNDFYTSTTLLSLTGSASAVWIITSVTGYILEPKDSRNLKKWLGLIISMILAFLGATQIQEQTLLTWVIAFFNGFLIYLTAVGANTVVGHEINSSESAQPPVRETSSSRKRGNFTELWW